MATKGFLVGDHSIRPRRAVRYVANKQASKTTKRKKKKPEWDNTVNDLTVHRASKEEQLKRHELHKSENTTKVLLQRQLKDSSLDSTLQTPDSVERRKLAIVQEVLYGHDKLQDVLTESDKAMSVVKDLFGDDPKKYMGFPNITAAPSHVLRGKENRFPVAEPPETPTHLSMLSDSVMRTPALNELSDDNKEDDEMAPGTPNSHEMHQARSYFQPKLDLQRFQQYVAEEQSRYIEQPQQPHLNECGPDHVALKEQGSDHLALYGRGNDHVTGHDSMLPGSAQDKPDLYPHASQPYFYPQGGVTTVGTITNDQTSGAFTTGHGTDHVAPPGSVASRTDRASQQATFLSQESVQIVAGSGPSVVNPVSTAESTASHSFPPDSRPSSSHTEITEQRPSKIEKAATSVTVSHKPALNSSAGAGATTLRSLDDLKKMVEQLEDEIAAYEMETGRPPTHVSTSSGSGSFSGYTVSLITAVTKLMGYLKESEIQHKAEMIMREQVLQGFEEQRVLVDALTNDILHTQEQNLALQQELLEYRKTTDEQLQYLKRELFAVLKSHEYQELSSTINTLYNLNPVALKRGALDQASENHNLEYLPRVPMRWTQNTAQQPNTHGTVTSQGSSHGHNQRQHSHSDTMKQPSFIPLADSQGSHSSLQLVNQSRNHHLPVQSNVQVTTGNANGQQRFVAPKSVPDHELPHNGHATLVYNNNSVPPSAMHYGVTSNNQPSSNIVMYPPSQASLSEPQMSIPSAPGKRPSVLPVRNQSTHHSSVAVPLATSTVPPVRNESTSLISRSEGVGTAPSGRSEPIQFGSMELSTVSQPRQESVPTSSTVGVSGTSTALPLGNKPVHVTTVTSTAPLYSSHQHPPGQSVSGTLLQTQFGKAVSRSLEPTQPSSISQGVRLTTVSEAVPRSAASGPGHTVQAVSIPPGKTSHTLHQHQHQPSQQNDAVPSVRPQHLLKPNGFAPFSRTMAGSLPAGHQLRERLQNLANRQKTLAVKGDQNVGSLVPVGQGKGETREVQQPRPSSPHVHFKEPPVAGEGHDTAKEHGRKSPMVSPIPHKSAVAAQRSTVPSDNRVVVNLPNAWSDVSSTISL